MKLSSFTLIIILHVSLNSCSSCGNKEQKAITNTQETSQYNEYGSYSSSPSTNHDSVQIKGTSETGTLKNSTMSREEDAYEEGRALAEEDRLNRTRQHEGDCDDDDYEDDYDEGYSEEE